MGQAPAREELLAALATVREAIDIPHAATARDAEIRAQILYQRLQHAVDFLDHVLGGHGAGDIPRCLEDLRDQLAKHPAAGYKTWNQLKTELERQPAGEARRSARRAPAVAQEKAQKDRDGRSRRGHRPGRPPPGHKRWTCRGCGGQVTGRPPGGLCAECRAAR